MLQRARVFSKIVLRLEYHQLWMAKIDIPKMMFKTRYKYYKFLVMHFGLINTPYVFITLINKIF